jgi:hypothetical protein
MPGKLAVAARIHLLVNEQHGSQPPVHNCFPKKSWYVVASAWKGESNAMGRAEVFLREQWEPASMGRAEVFSRAVGIKFRGARAEGVAVAIEGP